MIRDKIGNEDIYICKSKWKAEDIPITLFLKPFTSKNILIIKCTKKKIIRKKPKYSIRKFSLIKLKSNLR